MVSEPEIPEIFKLELTPLAHGVAIYALCDMHVKAIDGRLCMMDVSLPAEEFKQRYKQLLAVREAYKDLARLFNDIKRESTP